MATQLETLSAINEAMKAEPFYLFLSASVSKPLLKKGFVEVNETIKNDDCQFATRLTEAGMAFLNSNSEAVSASVPAKAVKMNFEIKSAPLPTVTRKPGAGRPKKYPFDALEVGQYFFVPATEKRPDPAKSLGSVVTTANRSYANETGETKLNKKGDTVPVLAYTRKFVVRVYNETIDGEIVPGAGVWRTE